MEHDEVQIVKLGPNPSHWQEDLDKLYAEGWRLYQPILFDEWRTNSSGVFSRSSSKTGMYWAVLVRKKGAGGINGK